MLMIALVLASPLARAACQAEPPIVTVVPSLPDPPVDNSLNRVSLKELSPNAGHPQGFYQSRLEIQSTVKMRAARACMSITEVELRVTSLGRRIFIASEWRPASCAYGAILGHERKHQAVDDQLVQEQSAKIRDTMRASIIEAGPVVSGPAVQQVVKDRLTKIVQDAMHRALETLTEEEQRRETAVDSPSEYARVAASCPELH